MGAPESGMQAGEQPAAAELLGAFKRIDAADRRRHESVLGYWLSIRGDKEFPPLHDLDPLELSDAAPSSLLLELISGGHDAEIRHRGDALKAYVDVERMIDAAHPSLLSCIAKKLPIVAISRDFLAFEDEYSTKEGETRCWVTLLPLSAGGAWVDYVYALVSIATEAIAGAEPPKKAAKKAETPEPPAAEVEETVQEPVAEGHDAPAAETEPEASEVVEERAEPTAAAEAPGDPEPRVEEPAPAAEIIEEPEAVAQEVEAPAEEVVDTSSAEEPVESGAPKGAPGFSKLLDSLAGLTGFYGSHGIKAEPVMPKIETAVEPTAVVEEEAAAAEELAEEEAVADHIADPPVETTTDAEPTPKQSDQPAPAPEGSLQSKLTEVRAKADEARMAKLRANAALYEGLSAAYDFALDAEDAPEEYLRLVEAQGLKIQLRSPMKPVVKLAFNGMCDDATIKQLEAVLAWAFQEELPRGTLAERIEAAGGVGRILNGEAKAA